MRVPLAALVGALSLSAAGVAEAQDMSMMMDLQRSCMADAKQHCSKEMPKPEQLMQCLVDNREKLSKPCQASTDRIAKTLGLKPSAPPKK